jgi:hypothetical protein
VSWRFFLRGFLAAFFRWRIAAADIVFGMPRPSRAKAAACSFLGVSLMVVSERETKAYSLSNHFAIIFALIFCAPCASIRADGDKLKLGNITLAASSR